VIPDDILTVAAVVTGEERHKLTGWQRDHAIAAMTALGYSGQHIAWTLDTSWSAVYQAAHRAGLRINHHDQRPDWTAIDMVTSGTAHLRLTGVDRDEAIRAMADTHTTTEIARRLLTKPSHINRIADRLGVEVRQAEPPNWYAYIRPNSSRPAVAA